MSSLLPGLTGNGTLVVVGASEDPLEVSTALLILGRRNIKGWSAGTPSDSEDTLRFAEATESSRLTRLPIVLESARVVD
jgi:D-arabinose 1-dehydrogenase-like Zn-dependent alcohol dehydrogenase